MITGQARVREALSGLELVRKFSFVARRVVVEAKGREKIRVRVCAALIPYQILW